MLFRSQEALRHPQSLTADQAKEWEAWNSNEAKKSRRDLLYDENGVPRISHYGTTRLAYCEKLRGKEPEELERVCEKITYFADFCKDKPNADWHWMLLCCAAEMFRRTHTSEWFNRVSKASRKVTQ